MEEERKAENEQPGSVRLPKGVFAVNCPICGGAVRGGSCLSCGYEIPDESRIAAVYNYDPSDYDPGAAGDEALPEAEMESISMESISADDIAAISSAAAAPVAAPAVRTASPPAADNIKTNAPPATPTAGANPYANFNPAAGSPQDSPVENGSFSVSNMIVHDAVEFIKIHGWQIIVAFLLPTAGFIFGAYYIWDFREERKVGSIILAVSFLTAAVLLKAVSFDISGLDAVIWELLKEFLRE